MFENLGKKVIEHLPEILTVGACGGVIAGDILLVKGAKKEAVDGDKKHYIPGVITTGIGLACIIGSNRVSNYQKVTLAGVAAVLASQSKNQREFIENKYGDDVLHEMDEEVNKKKEKAVKPSNGKSADISMIHYYFPQFGLEFDGPEISKEVQDRAEIDINKFFDSGDMVSLDDVLQKLGLSKYAYYVSEDKHVARNTIFAYDWDSDYPQQLVFEVKDVEIRGEKKRRFRILQLGAKNSESTIE